MILSETSSRKPSRIGFWIVLGLGALFLPLAPRAARTEAPEKPKQVESKARTAKPVIAVASWKFEDDIPAREISKAKNCLACHTQQTVNSHDLQHPWKEIHDELLRLTEEYTRELRKSDRRPSSIDDRHAQEIEKLQDEIELLKAQVQLKEARVEAAKKTLSVYQRRQKTYEEINQRQRGTIPIDTITETQLAVITHEGQIQINDAELQESRVRLKQAERRLARLQRPGEKTDGGGREQQEKRLRELEQKVESLLKEIHNLRRDMRPDKPSEPKLQPDRLKR